MNRDKFWEEAERVANQLECHPDELAMEVLRWMEVAGAESRLMYGNHKRLGELLKTRSLERANLLTQVRQLQEKQDVLFRRLDEATSLAVSIITQLRMVYGLRNEMHPMASIQGLQKGLGCTLPDGRLFPAPPAPTPAKKREREPEPER